jgi:citrate lyase subunit beta/citryl-CoA lyase
VIRSWLYVPADRPDRVAKARATQADAVIIDLEDAVAAAAKAAARRGIAAALTERSRPALWVRINAGDAGREDVAALAATSDPLSGIVLAKCESTDWIDEIASRLPASVSLVPLIESARALRRLDAICAHPRVAQCHLGEIDLLADLGTRPGGTREMVSYARAEIITASAAAGLLPPIGGVFADVRDVDALADDCVHLADLGFAGRPALHPAQVPIINSAFRPSADELAEARRVVTLYDNALASGVGAISDESRTMLDEAVVRRFRRLLDGEQPGSPASGPVAQADS